MYKFLFTLSYLIFNLIITQNIFSGTILSSVGTGTPTSYPNTRSLGMGGVSIAIQDYHSISRTNPANISSIPVTYLSVQYFYELNQYRDRNDQALSDYGNFDGFSFVLPFGSGFSISGSLKPITRVDYKLSFENNLNDEMYIKSITGKGGLNTFSISFAWKIRSNLSLGCFTHYLFGKINEEWKVKYDKNDFVMSNDYISTKNWGYGLTVGIHYSPFSAMTLGAIYSPNAHLENHTEIAYYLRSEYETTNGSLDYPKTWGIGAALHLWKNSIIGIDFEQWNWSKTSINNQQVQNLRDMYRISLGTEFPSSTHAYNSYFSRIAFRLGLSYQPYSSLDTEGNTISESMLTIGFGLPFLMNNSQIDIALGYGRRGSISKNGLVENLFRLSISMSGGEKWFSSVQ